MDVRNIIKFVGACAIPLGIYALFNWSIKRADEDLAQHKLDIKAHPLTEKTTIDNYELKEIDGSNHVKWRLFAKQGILDAVKGNKDIYLDHVRMEYYDGNELKMRMTAPKGVANEDTKIVNLSSDPKERVIADGSKGKLEASQVVLTKRNQFVATGDVNIVLPGVAKVTGDQALGVLEKDASLKNFKIVGKTHAICGI
jgi:hypothetical protein